MPRDIPVGNGRLLINFDRNYQIRDIYFPHPGQENHSEGEAFRFGVWADGEFSWVASADWSRELDYQEDSLVTLVRLRSERLALELVANDAVDFYENVFLRRIIVRNLLDRPREVRVFFHQDFRIHGTESYDTAYYDPTTLAVVHYERNTYFLIGCQSAQKQTFDQWATGNKEFRGAEGTWRDAEDGRLEGNPIAQGSVDSTISIWLKIKPAAEESLAYWIAAGHSHHDVRLIDSAVRSKTPEKMIKRTMDYWRAWVNKESLNFGELPADVISAFKRSLLMIRLNIGDNGAITAANDADVLNYNRDTYSYMWPRDGALTAYALDVAGLSELTRRFYSFTKKLITRDGHFLHKYTPDGSPGSSWHPWISGNQMQLPIQEDETALIIWGLWKHYNEHRDIEFIADFYRPVIKLAADFLLRYRYPETGLPRQSWDLWEERRGVHTYTVATVWAGLQAAARFADLFGERDLTAEYVKAADEVKQGLVAYLYRPEIGRFARTMRPSKTGTAAEAEYDTTVDASLFAVWYFGVLDADDPMVRSTMQAVREKLWVRTGVGGLARYEGDSYYRMGDNVSGVGNPWFVCTLWLAEYEIIMAKTAAELRGSLEMIQWVVKHALRSGVLAEQVNPRTGEPLSVSPLTWSHSQFVTAVMEYLHKLSNLKICETCGQRSFDYIRHETGVLPARLNDFPGKDGR